MGDRGNIVLQYPNEPALIYLYTHWAGSTIGAVVHRALSKRERWDDPAYLARIIFDELTNCVRTTTSFGIAPYPCDNEHDYLFIDFEKQTVARCPPICGNEPGEPIESWSFQAFIDNPIIADW